ncbi:hypothetical protein [Acetobacter fabarum]|uniref:hypothetical protein n=1 Tax=Acetobacter fabarum TaxID=483199 RepID=UPI0039E89F94
MRINRAQALELLDLVDESIRWSSVSMPDKERYYAAGNAMWSLAHMIAGNQGISDRLSRRAKDAYAQYLAKIQSREVPRK